MENIDWGSLGFNYMKTDFNARYTCTDGKWSDCLLYTSDWSFAPNRPPPLHLQRLFSSFSQQKGEAIDIFCIFASIGKIMNLPDPARPGKTFEAKYPNSDMCCKLLADMAPASPCVQELNVLRDIEFHLRNVAAHTIEPITEERIRKECRQNLRGSLLSNVEWSSSEIFKLLKQCAQSILSSSELRWNSYDLMNERILRAMRLDDQ